MMIISVAQFYFANFIDLWLIDHNMTHLLISCAISYSGRWFETIFYLNKVLSILSILLMSSRTTTYTRPTAATRTARSAAVTTILVGVLQWELCDSTLSVQRLCHTLVMICYLSGSASSCCAVIIDTSAANKIIVVVAKNICLMDTYTYTQKQHKAHAATKNSAIHYTLSYQFYRTSPFVKSILVTDSTT